MASPIVDPEIRDRLDALRNGGVESVPVGDISEIVENILESLGGDISAIDQSLVSELESLSAFIHASRADLAAVRPEAVREEHIPDAKDELDAIIGATERATEDIMTASEKIQAIAEMQDDETADELVEQVMLIFEACSFQDITGQRITKIVGTLQKIEENVESMLAVFGDETARTRVEDRLQEEIEPPPDADLMHGPQLEGGGNTQDDIDKLLASFD
jgi:chemotaxis protein CheZ